MQECSQAGAALDAAPELMYPERLKVAPNGYVDEE